jgi:hypothetical protein
MDITYCTGLWLLKNNRKHDAEHYYKNLPKTMKHLNGQKIVFFYEDERILEMARSSVTSEHFHGIKIRVEDLPTYRFSRSFLRSCRRQDNHQLAKFRGREKGLIHFKREFRLSGPEIYRKIISIWTSKIFLLNQVAERNLFGTEWFAWIDASLGRYSDRHLSTLSHLPYTTDRIHHYGSGMNYRGKRLNLSAGLLVGHRQKWSELFDLYREELEIAKSDSYAHDEETILNLVLTKRPELFRNINQLPLNVCSQKRVTFVHIPKTGGSTVEHLFFGRKELSEHLTASRYSSWKDHFCFAFVRNPYLRIVSIFNYYKNGGNQKNDPTIKCNLNRFLELHDETTLPHLKTQSHYIDRPINYIGRFETFNEDLGFLAKRFGIGSEIPHDRARKYKDYPIDPKLVEQINRRYSIDFERFGYSKIHLKEKVTLSKLSRMIEQAPRPSLPANDLQQ